MPSKIDLTGQRFGRLTVLHREPNKGRKVTWLCRCDCGASRVVTADNLRSGNTTSCGCFKSELAASMATTHGGCASDAYGCWEGIKDRCTNPNSHAWSYYGGQGVECRFTSFEQFRDEIGPRPTPEHTVDRFPDKKGHYEPGNIRWATPKQQNRNKGDNRLISWQGKIQCLAEWDEQLGFSRNTVGRRLRCGWSVERAFTTPASVRMTNNGGSEG